MINIYKISIIRIRGFSSTVVERVLESLCDSIRECNNAMRRAAASGVSDYADAVCDDESDVVEALTGTAFVAAQTEITATVSYVKGLRARYLQEFGRDLSSTSSKKADIMAFSSTLTKSGVYSTVQTINAFANYFKHNDEWISD